MSNDQPLHGPRPGPTMRCLVCRGTGRIRIGFDPAALRPVGCQCSYCQGTGRVELSRRAAKRLANETARLETEPDRQAPGAV